VQVTALTILGLAGSLRRGSFNRAALAAARALAPPGMTLDIYPLDGLPVYNPDLEAVVPAAALELRRRIRAADAVLFATAEYNYSIPAVLKNALEWGSRPRAENCWRGKPVAVMGASTSRLGTSRAQYHLRQVFLDLEVFPLPGHEVFIGQAREKFDAAQHLVDEEARAKITGLLAALAVWTRQVRLLAGGDPPAG
jgi:chromate reductase